MSKPVIVISSHVARGSVGNRAAVFALEALRHRVWAVPTIILPFHPGHGPATRIVPDPRDFETFLQDLLNSPWISEVGAVLSGYMANASQAETVGRFVTGLRALNKEITYVCDPVMGDFPKSTGKLADKAAGTGNLYVGQQTAEAIRDHLVPLADIVTPNLFELSWLVGAPTADHQQAIEAALNFQDKTFLVTSMPGFMRGNIGNLLVERPSKGSTIVFAEHRELKNPPNGPGDLTAALFLSHTMAGLPPEKALQKTTASVFETIAGAAKRGSDELMLEIDASSINTPMTMVSMRSLTVGPDKSGRAQPLKPSTM